MKKNINNGQEPKEQYPEKTTSCSDLEDMYGIEKPLVEGTMNIGWNYKNKNK